MGDIPDHPPGALRHVLRLRHIGDLRTGAQRHPAGPGQLLSDAAAQRRHLAHRRDARGAQVHLALPAPDDGDDFAPRDAHQGLADLRAGRLQRIHIVDSLDHTLPYDKFISIEIQTRVRRDLV